MQGIGRTWLYNGVIGLAIAASSFPTTGWSEEIAPFRLTGIEGNVSLRYLRDEQSVGGSRESRTAFEEEIFVLTHSYFYHPNLIKMDLGVGPLFVQSDFESMAGSNQSDETLYNAIARFSFLEKKPYPFAIYYERLNPSVSTGLAQTFIQENTKYGFNFTLREPVSPVLINLEAFRQRSEGQGFDLIVDDTIEQATLRAYRSFGPGGYGQLVYQTNRRESRSGSPNLPIQETVTTTNSANFDSRYLFGSNRQYQLTNILTYVTQEQFPTRRDLRFSPDLRVAHSETLNSFYRYGLLNGKQEGVETTNQSITAGLNHRPNENFSSTFDVHADDNETTGLTQQTYGVTGLVSYHRPIPVGSLQLSAGVRYDQNDRVATVSQVAVFGESQILTGTTPVTLGNAFIVTATIVVSNITRTQTYVAGLDYEVIVIGSQTQIRRLIGGNILDGQQVLVDYEYLAGGTAKYTLFDKNIQANVTLYRYYNVYARWRDADQTLKSGMPTIPLNSIQNIQVGARADYPFWQEWVVGGEVTFEDQKEDIASYDRESYDAYLQIPFPRFTTLRISGRAVQVDNKTSTEDVDLTGYGIRFRSRPWPRASITAELSYETDVGGTTERRTWGRTLGAEWRIRQLTLTAEGRFVRERQGVFERERTLIRAIARRDF